MDFTALHRALGIGPAPWTDALLDEAVAAGVVETDDLDWKSELPPAKAIPQTDFPKDVAAMANSGGGVIVYGVEESQKAATGRRPIGPFDEVHERSLRSAAVTAVSPPVFGLGVHRLGEGDQGHVRAVVVVVPASNDVPHLIYRGEYFGAPVRNNADTVWMKERQIEAMYRARLEERRHTAEAIENLYDEAAAGRDTGVRAWLVAVAHPRLPAAGAARPTRDEARALFATAGKHALAFADRVGVHPLDSVDRLNPRPGLRRWIAANTAAEGPSRWREAWVSLHHDGSATLAAAVGGHRTREGHLPGERIESSAIECAVADFMGLIRAAGEWAGASEYEVKVGIEWTGVEPLSIQTVDAGGFPAAALPVPLASYAPVTATVFATADSDDYHWQVHDLAQDCVNQGGIDAVRIINPPPRD